MDKLISIIMLTIAVQGVAMASDNRLANADYDYQLISRGKTIDVVEFTPRNNPGVTCAVVTTNGQVVMNCFPKARKRDRGGNN
jgi:hypothetical protein